MSAETLQSMGRIHFLLGLRAWLLLFLSVGVLAQPLPQDFGVVYFTGHGRLEEMEAHRPPLVRQPELRGYSREFLRIPGAESSERFPENQTLHWTVRHRTEVRDTEGTNWTALSFVPLELQSALKQDRTSFFASTTEEFLVVPGAKSSVRFKVNTPIVFYLRVFLDESDPRAGFFPLRDPTKFKLVELNADKEQRKMTLVKSGFTYTKRQVGRPLLVRLYGEHCFQLSPSEALAPGEYAVKYLRESEDSDEEEQFELFCFGVDR